MPAIQLEGVAKHWGTSRALDDITFSADPGSFVVLLGPSGCGKSTTLRLIAGLDTPTHGTIRIGDRDVTRLPPAERGIAMVFQSYALFPHLSVAENIVFGLRVRKVADREARLARVAELLGLGPLLARKPSQLSGGQQQRVALGRALGGRGSGVPDGRAAFEPRRAAARRDAPGDPRAAAAPRHHHGLRDPRPDRSHDDGRSRGADARRPDRAGGIARGALRAARDRFHRFLHPRRR